MRYQAIIPLFFLLAACGGGGGGTPPTSGTGGTGGGGGGGGSQTASVAISVSLPNVVTDAKTRRPMYISPYTQSVNVTAQQGSQTAQAAFNCNTSAHICQGSINAPLGQVTFTVTLMTGTNGGGKALADGVTTQTVNAGNNTLDVTFNPVVGSVRLQYSQPHWGSPYLSSQGPSSVAIDVLAVDAAGNTIVGPGSFVDAQGNALTIKLSGSSAHTSISPASFTAPQANANDVAMLSLSGTPAPFEEANLGVAVMNTSGQAAAGIGTQGLNVPISPTISTGFVAAANAGPDPDGPQMRSLYGVDALQNFQYDGQFWHTYAPVIVDITVSQSGAGGEQTVCCSTSAITPSGNSVDHLLGGVAAPHNNDTGFWFEDPPNPNATPAFNGALSFADVTTQSSQDDIVAFSRPLNAVAMVADSNGKLWVAQEQSSGPPLISQFDPGAPPSTLAPITLPSDQSGGTVDALVPGTSGTVYAVVSSGANTYIDTLVSAKSGPSFTFEASTALKLRNANAVGYYPVVGYAPRDNAFYAVDGAGTNYYRLAVSGSSIAVTTLTSNGPVITTSDTNRKPMSVLPDGSLAFEGASPAAYPNPNPSGGGDAYFYAHIVPGRTPAQVSVIPPACGSSSPCYLYNVWSILVQGNAVVAGSTDGGKSHALIW